mgnify:FL=1
MREEEMAVNVAKQIYFDEFNSFYLIAEGKKDNAELSDVFGEQCICHTITEKFIYRLNKCNDFTKEGLNKERIIAMYVALDEDDGYFNDTQIRCYIEYTDKIIDEILKQDVVLGGEQNSSN